MGTESAVAQRRITRLVPDPRRAGLVKLDVDGRPAFTVPAEVVSDLGLSVEAVLRPEAESVLGREADAVAAYRTVLRCLEQRPYAVRDLIRRLVLKGHPTEAAERAVTRAEKAGLLDDEAYARHYVETRFARGRGPSRLRRELMAFGVAGAIIDRVVAEGVSAEAANARMLALASKRAGQLAHLPEASRRRRVLAYLARRGFQGHEAIKAVESAM